MRIVVLVFLMQFLWSTGQAQVNVTVSGKEQPLITVIEDIEEQSDYKFYFLPGTIDTIKVTPAVTTASVAGLLASALAGTGVNFYIEDNKVILTSGIELIADVERILRPTRQRDVPIDPLELAPATNNNRVISIGTPGVSLSKTFQLSGYVRDRASGEPIGGALVSSANVSAVTASDGSYSLMLPRGAQELQIKFLGMVTTVQRVVMRGPGRLDIQMVQDVTQLKEVIIESNNEANVSNVQMGITKIDVSAAKNIPKILGENDLLKVAVTIPGVKSIGEGASGINVRGGHADQNLVVLNEATIYNTSHFLGFFSVFNADAIQSFELYKSGIPVQHGGRLSSTFELKLKEGNDQKFSGYGGIGPITSSLTLEVPVIKEKTILVAGGRGTYSNWVLKTIPESVIKNTRAGFYDAFAKVTHKFNRSNTISLSLYGSQDDFNLSSDTTFSYSNKLASLQWHHVFNSTIDATLSITRSEYQYDIAYAADADEAFNLGFDINDSNVKWDFSLSKYQHKINFGFQSRLYYLNPGFISKGSDVSIVQPRSVQREKGLESAVFAADNVDLTDRLSLYYGIRYSFFHVLGPRTINVYADDSPRANSSIIDSAHYDTNQVLGTFHGPEYRTSLRYKLDLESSVKASYNRTRQYIHMLSNTVSLSPTDTWKLTDPNVEPQIADQVSMGYYRDLKEDVFEFSAEAYYKWIQNILDFKIGASLLVNDRIDQQIVQGKGKAYGIELLLKKKSGKLTGWFGYAYSRTFLRLKSEFPEEQINRGEYFPASYDKPHDVNLVTNYKITRRYSFSFNFAYSTGRPVTYPIAAYRFGNAYRINYSDRNAARIDDYIRADLGFNIEGNHKLRKLAHSYWSISIYNLWGRRNPYSVYFKVEDGEIRAYKLSIFGVPIPTVTYHFRF